mmetsp:Transcript_73446/g.175106  ORF Transcript_73446/g.175106 Transcript_73446/m.175106 type:complete len:295 (+) Transcript_73446:845-1729(+)
MLHLLGPTFWHNAAGRFIQLLPSEELLHVCLRVMLVLSIPWLHKVEVVNGLGANGAMASAHHRDMGRAVLQRRAHVLHREGAHAGDDHPLAAPNHACQRVRRAICHHAGKVGAPWRVQRPRQAHAIVDAQHDATALRNASALRHRILEEHGVVAPLPQHLHDLHGSEDVVLELVPKLGEVGQDLCSGAVVAVVPCGLAVILANQLLDAVAALGAVHLRSGVGVHGPDAAHQGPLLQNSDAEAGAAAAVCCEHSKKPCTHDDDIRRGWRRCDARQNQTSLVKARLLQSEIAGPRC